MTLCHGSGGQVLVSQLGDLGSASGLSMWDAKIFVVFRCRFQYLAHNLANVKTQTEFGNERKFILDLLFQFIEVFLFLISRHLVCPKYTKMNPIA